MRISPALKKVREKEKLFIVKKKEMINKKKGMRNLGIMDRILRTEMEEKATKLLGDIQSAISEGECASAGKDIIDLDSKLGMSLTVNIVIEALENAYKLGRAYGAR